MANEQTFGDLYKAKAIIEADLNAAVEAYMAGSTICTFKIGDGYGVDIAAAVAASPFASAVIADVHATELLKRTFVRTAILLAQPLKA